MENLFFKCKGPIKISEISNILNLKDKPPSNDQLVKDIKDLFSSEINYMSDSKGLWNSGHPLNSDAFKNKLPLQILIHPIWWNNQSIDAYQNLLNYVDKKKYNLEKNLANPDSHVPAYDNVILRFLLTLSLIDSIQV